MLVQHCTAEAVDGYEDARQSALSRWMGAEPPDSWQFAPENACLPGSVGRARPTRRQPSVVSCRNAICWRMESWHPGIRTVAKAGWLRVDAGCGLYVHKSICCILVGEWTRQSLAHEQASPDQAAACGLRHELLNPPRMRHDQM
jgi:hypothetical protein